MLDDAVGHALPRQTCRHVGVFGNGHLLLGGHELGQLQQLGLLARIVAVLPVPVPVAQASFADRRGKYAVCVVGSRGRVLRIATEGGRLVLVLLVFY